MQAESCGKRLEQLDHEIAALTAEKNVAGTE